ncbi:MAG: hypothetical protein A2052_05685 [Deltaproteobacteria bacterium GWA2_54_12]|nr:MAG: hypothetical protein A2052_05685 [Deltaproteobacteria bacterium GWA2_54_12]
MKKNLISIVLLVGAVTLNLSMLSQARCAGGQDRQVNAAQAAQAVAPQGNSACCAAHSRGQEVKDGGGRNAQHGSGVKCVCGVDGPGAHLDFNFIVAAVEFAPENHALQTLPTTVSVFTNAAPVPQDRPPKLLA